MFRSRSRVEKKLRQAGNEVDRLTEDLRVLTEQRSQLADEAEDARLRSIVSDDPAASGEYSESSKTERAFTKDYDAKSDRLAKLRKRQDELLDELMGLSRS